MNNGAGTPHPEAPQFRVPERTGPALPSSSLEYLCRCLDQQWKRYRRQLKRCQKKFSEKSVHESRVSARRLGSTVELVATFVSPARANKIGQLLKRHLDTFDDLRDTQVQLSSVLRVRRRFSSVGPFYDHLLRRESRLAKKARRDIGRVRAKPLARLVKATLQDLQHEQRHCSARKAAARLERSVKVAFQKVDKLRSRIDPDDTRTIHRTRVAFKKFRYMVELLARELAPVDDKRLSEMQHYQTMMGEIQDVEVLMQALDKFVGKKAGKRTRLLKFREELARRRQWLIRVYLNAAGQLDEFWPLPITEER